MSKAPFILLINPWITDFAAHDLWARPMGLLYLGALLREGGCGVALIDCLDRQDPLTLAHPGVLPGVNRKHGTGKYPKMMLPKPEAYAETQRVYYRYGIHPESFRMRLRSLPKPDLIWMTSIMTYWYPGIQQATELLREWQPEVPVWLGGIYANLCADHAREKSGASLVVTVPPDRLPDWIEAATGFRLKNREQWSDFNSWPHPALDLLPHNGYAPVLTSRGCPFHCPYCASNTLQPVWERRSADTVFEEIARWHRELGAVDFAFYDDALLLGAETTLKPVLERIRLEGMRLRFHTPNALHIRALTPEWCELLRASGFTTIRLGLETTRADHQKRWGGKVETEMFLLAVRRLKNAGFPAESIGVYLLCGLPGQSPEEVAEAIEVVRSVGAQPFLAEYSPIPGTSMWPEAVALSSFDLHREPLYQNNSFFACRRPDFSCSDLGLLKDLARRVRRSNMECRPSPSAAPGSIP